MPGRWPWAQPSSPAGVRLTANESLAKPAADAPESQISGVDLVLNNPINFGMGYGLANPNMPLPPSMCYWGGWGGSLIRWIRTGASLFPSL